MKGLKLRKSCDECSRKKVKCDGVRPQCTRCYNRGAQCVYQLPKQRGPKPGLKQKIKNNEEKKKKTKKITKKKNTKTNTKKRIKKNNNNDDVKVTKRTYKKRKLTLNDEKKIMDDEINIGDNFILNKNNIKYNIPKSIENNLPTNTINQNENIYNLQLNEKINQLLNTHNSNILNNANNNMPLFSGNKYYQLSPSMYSFPNNNINNNIIHNNNNNNSNNINIISDDDNNILSEDPNVTHPFHLFLLSKDKLKENEERLKKKREEEQKLLENKNINELPNEKYDKENKFKNIIEIGKHMNVPIDMLNISPAEYFHYFKLYVYHIHPFLPTSSPCETISCLRNFSENTATASDYAYFLSIITLSIQACELSGLIDPNKNIDSINFYNATRSYFSEIFDNSSLLDLSTLLNLAFWNEFRGNLNMKIFYLNMAAVKRMQVKEEEDNCLFPDKKLGIMRKCYAINSGIDILRSQYDLVQYKKKLVGYDYFFPDEADLDNEENDDIKRIDKIVWTEECDDRLRFPCRFPHLLGWASSITSKILQGHLSDRIEIQSLIDRLEIILREDEGDQSIRSLPKIDNTTLHTENIFLSDVDKHSELEPLYARNIIIPVDREFDDKHNIVHVNVNLNNNNINNNNNQINNNINNNNNKSLFCGETEDYQNILMKSLSERYESCSAKIRRKNKNTLPATAGVCFHSFIAYWCWSLGKFELSLNHISRAYQYASKQKILYPMPLVYYSLRIATVLSVILGDRKIAHIGIDFLNKWVGRVACPPQFVPTFDDWLNHNCEDFLCHCILRQLSKDDSLINKLKAFRSS